MKWIFYKILLMITLCIAIPANAQNIVIDGEIRPRTEFQDGFKMPLLKTNDPGFFTSQRTRLGFNFSNEFLQTQITLQDVRIFGQYNQNDASATTGIYEAWADMTLFPGTSLKIGRQAVKYDDGRIFSAPTWNITGTTHDLALIRYNLHDFRAHLGFAYNNKSETATEVFYVPGFKYRALGFLWLSSPDFNGFTFSGIITDEGLQDTLGLGGISNYKKNKLAHTYTFGGNIKYESSEFPLSGLFTSYFQGGKNVGGNTMTGRMAALKLNYRLNKYFLASIGTDYFSGDENGNSDNKASNFKKLYGADHTFNGYMDYWNTPLNTGLLDYYGGFTTKIGKDLTLETAYHLFNTEFEGKNKMNIAYAKNIGSELDLILTYKLNCWVTMQGGYCRYFFNNNTLIAKEMLSNESNIPVIRSPQWVYVMFTVKPTFLKTVLSGK